MTLKLILVARPLHTRITPRLGKRQLHRLVEQLEALHLLNRLLRALHAVEHNERLALRLQVRLRDNVDDLAIFGEQLGQRFFELGDFDVLFEVADVDAGERLVGEQEARVRAGVQ